MGVHVDAVARHEDRHVTDQPHPTRRRVPAERAPFAIEAHLVGERLPPGEAHVVLDPVRVAARETRRAPRGRRAPAGPRPARATRRTPTRRCRASEGRPAGRAAAPATTTARRPRASRRTCTPRRRAARREARSGGAARRSSATLHARGSYLILSAGDVIAEGRVTATADPDRGRLADARLRPLRGQADAGATGRGVGGHLQRRPRDPPGGGKYRPVGARGWLQMPMEHHEADRWRGSSSRPRSAAGSS